MTRAIFLSYSSDDADAARRICEALRAAGLEVWFDQSELRGGDAWDQSIRKQIKECALFVPIISTATDAREEGYFRLEWKLAVDRTHLMADNKAFLVPVLLQGCSEATALVPEKFRERQWSRVGDDSSVSAFASRVAKLLDGSAPPSQIASNGVPPSGLNQSAREAAPELVSSTGAWSRNPLLLGIVSVLVAVIGVGSYFAMQHRNTVRSSAASTEPITSVAVLPFQAPNNATDADTDYLSVGLAETLIYQLSRLPKLKVSPASSVYRYKGKEIDPPKVGAELGVAAVMTGRLIQRGESLSISVELVDVRNNKSLWGERYDRKMADLLATQRDIATEITRKLQLSLSGESPQLAAAQYTNSNDAYQAFLKGRYLYQKRGLENLTRSVEHYREAIRLDPQFALAYVGLADSYGFIYYFDRSDDPLGQAIAAAKQALAIAPDLADAHSALATLFAINWDWVNAERSYKRALALDDSIGSIHYFYALNFLLPNARFQEAIFHIERALALEPMSIPYAANLARANLYSGKTELALTQAQKVFALEPSHPAAIGNLMIILLSTGRHGEAIRVGETVAPESRSLLAQEYLALAYALAGRAPEARARLGSLAAKRAGVLATTALVQVVLGEREAAFATFEAAFRNKDFELVYLNVSPLSALIRDDPRFASLVKRIGLAK